MKMLLVVLLVGLLVGLGTYALVPAKAITPFVYDVPIHVEQTPDGYLFTTSRCNRTDHDLDVSVTAFWESDTPAIQPVPFQPVASGNAKVPTGCTSRQASNPVRADYLPTGRWRARGSVCIIGGPCSGWYSEFVVIQ